MAVQFSRTIFKDLLDDPQKGTLTLAIGSTLIVIFMIVVAIRPAIVSVIKQVQSNEVRRELILKQEEKIETLTELVGRQSEYVFEIELLNEVFPDFDDSEYVLRNLHEYLMINEDVQLVSMEIDHSNTISNRFPTAPISVGVIEVSFGVQSDIDQAYKLIDYLDKFPRILDIQTITYSALQNDNQVLPLTGSIDFNLYYIKDDVPNVADQLPDAI